MSVSAEYLAKVKFAVRTVSTDQNVIQELEDIVEECRADMIKLGVDEEIAASESNYLTLGCVRSFARAKFSIDPEDISENKEDYRLQVDELRKAVFEE